LFFIRQIRPFFIQDGYLRLKGNTHAHLHPIHIPQHIIIIANGPSVAVDRLQASGYTRKLLYLAACGCGNKKAIDWPWVGLGYCNPPGDMYGTAFQLLSTRLKMQKRGYRKSSVTSFYRYTDPSPPSKNK